MGGGHRAGHHTQLQELLTFSELWMCDANDDVIWSLMLFRHIKSLEDGFTSYFNTTMSSSLDPYTSQAQNNNHTLQEKIHGLKEIIKSTKTAMLTTRSADGELHSRAMNPVSPEKDNQLTLTFIANNVSHKFEELENDSHVNVSFLNPETTSWASFSGKARVSQDRDAIKDCFSKTTSAWFGDLKDGVHKGDANDPRVSIIQVTPDEIRYWYPTKGKVGRAVEVGISAVTSKTASSGELRTITKDEVQLTEGLHTK